MRRLVAIATVLGCLALPACAQRGGGAHGGFAGHAGSSSHGGFGGIAPSRGFAPSRVGRPAPFARYYPGAARSFRTAPSYARPGYGQRAYAQSGRNRMPYSPAYGRDHRRHGYIGSGYPLWSGWAAPWIPDYPLFYDDNFDQDDSTQSAYGPQTYPDYGAGPETAQYPDQAPYTGSSGSPYAEPYNSGGEPTENPGASGAPYRPSSQLPQQARAPYNPSSAHADSLSDTPVTVVFKDGRPSEKIRNYLLTSTTLTVLDQHRQEIPVNQIDLVATARINREAGVDFDVPAMAHP